MTLFAQAHARIYGIPGSWSLAPIPDSALNARECGISLELQGDEDDGYHLVMSPTGFFTADNWYASKDEALIAAFELFGISREAWRDKHDEREHG